jgi:hypothetical protein
MLAIDHLTRDLQNDLYDVKLAISITNTDLDTKVASVSTALATFHDTIGENIKSLHCDLLDQVQAISTNVDNAIILAHSEWCLDIDSTLLSSRSKFTSTAHSVDSKLQDTNLKLDSIFETFSSKVSNPQVLCLLSEATLDHIRNLTLSQAINEVISHTVAENIAPISNDLLPLKNSSMYVPLSTKSKLGFAQVASNKICVSIFTNELECIHLQSDTLKDLELF